MINRIMSINFPVQANQFNHLKINPSSSVDWWHGTLINLYTKPPYWIYTKTKKKESQKTENKKDYSEVEYFFPTIPDSAPADVRTTPKRNVAEATAIILAIGR
jgi:hypothetical protein